MNPAGYSDSRFPDRVIEVVCRYLPEERGGGRQGWDGVRLRQVGARSLVAPTGIAPASEHRQLLACGAQDTVTGSGADLQTIQQQLSFEKQLSWTQSDKEF